jgi:hypothetical protein
VPLALLSALWLRRKSHPELWTGAVIFVAGVAPVLGITTFLFQYYSTTADHYLYLSMLGPAVAAAPALSRSRTRLPVALAVIILILMGARTILQTSVWLDDERLFRNALRVCPDSFAARNNLGHYYGQIGRKDEAMQLFREAVALRP